LVLAIVRDVTATKKREEQRAKKIKHQREDLMATLAHDLRVPLLGADRTLAVLLQGSLGELKDDQRQVISALKRSNDQLLNRIQNLLAVYRYESTEILTPVEEIDTARLLNRCL